MVPRAKYFRFHFLKDKSQHHCFVPLLSFCFSLKKKKIKTFKFEIIVYSLAGVRNSTERSHVLFTQFSPKANLLQDYSEIPKLGYGYSHDTEHFYHHKDPSYCSFIAIPTSAPPLHVLNSRQSFKLYPLLQLFHSDNVT